MRQLKIQIKPTDRKDEVVDKYLNEISRIPMINVNEEVELFQKMQKGDQRAKEKLIKANLRFVVSVAKQYDGQGLPLIDLINEGNYGLIKAVERFDETRGFKFISYAVWWIRQSIMHALSNQGRLVRLPMSQIHVASKINQRINEFIQENQRYPSTTEIAELVDLDRSIVQSIITANKFSTSLDSTFPDDDTPIMDTLAGNENVDENLETESLYSDLHSVLSGILSSREIGILCSYYGIGCQEETLEEMGIKYNLSRERVRQIKENSLKKIRKSSSINVLKKYL